MPGNTCMWGINKNKYLRYILYSNRNFLKGALEGRKKKDISKDMNTPQPMKEMAKYRKY